MQNYIKEKKLGEGTYAVVYLGKLRTLSNMTGTQISTSQKVAIKKIRLGQFKDGLDMSAIREIKTLKELKHPNIIDVRLKL
jgi:cyclin-dependent kinase 7